ncbi:MAG: HDIG domain-containing protein, partial [Candidatus Hydrogenedentes bacterium]|nr:HDIG domain-containing protein [Candidatus Hydrogenedentota bacterium]
MSLAPQESPSLAHRKQRLQRLVIAGSFFVLVISVTEFSILGDPAARYDIDAEAVAARTVRADFAFESEDLDATREGREKAAALVPSTYTIATERVSSQLQTLQQRIITLKGSRDEIGAAIEDALLGSTPEQTEVEIVGQVVLVLADEWKADPLFEGFPEKEFLATWVMPDLESVPKRILSEDGRKVTGLSQPATESLQFAHIEPLTNLALEGLEYVLTEGVRQQGAFGNIEPGEARQRVVILRSKVFGDLKRSEDLLVTEVPDPILARPNLRNRIDEIATRMEEEDAVTILDWNRLRSAAFEMARSSLTDTLIYDQVKTEGDRELERSKFEAVTRRFDARQILQEEGHRWTDQARHDVKTYWSIAEGGDQRTRSIFSPFAANAILVSLLLLAYSRALPLLVDKKANVYTSVNVAMLITCGMLVLGRILSSAHDTGLLVPIAASAMLLTILTNPRLAAMTTLIIAVLLSIQYGYSWQLLIIGGAMAFTGIVSLYTVRKRTDMARAALRATGIGLLTALAVALAAGSMFSKETVPFLGIIVLNGIACLLIVPGLLSPLERLFGITTDIQLLEYSDLNNEILSRLAIEVPATYAHSLMMGQLAEAAADAVDANGLMARVCAYYHDIGKLRRPEYFSENQTGYNIHEELSPRLSARAIASHVTEGVEIAREFHLPQPIIRGILEHHGTLLISFFYQQALDQQKHGDVREEDYRYSGPKPQSPETAILMICDGVESGVRSIRNPNEERVREFVNKIIQGRSADRQFDECDLTLKKLDTIGEVLTKRIITTMHTRVIYPERAVVGEADNVIRISRGRD